jgi:hypothetical protein
MKAEFTDSQLTEGIGTTAYFDPATIPHTELNDVRSPP